MRGAKSPWVTDPGIGTPGVGGGHPSGQGACGPDGRRRPGAGSEEVRVRGGLRRRALGLVAATAAGAAALSGCADPQYRFVSSSEHDVVVRVPWSWSRITRDDVLRARPGATAPPTAEESQVPAGTWIAYYDGA